MTILFNDPNDQLPDDDDTTEDDLGDYEDLENELNNSIYPDIGQEESC